MLFLWYQNGLEKEVTWNYYFLITSGNFDSKIVLNILWHNLQCKGGGKQHQNEVFEEFFILLRKEWRLGQFWLQWLWIGCSGIRKRQTAAFWSVQGFPWKNLMGSDLRVWAEILTQPWIPPVAQHHGQLLKCGIKVTVDCTLLRKTCSALRKFHWKME